jgi:TrmH family RNA methyltransferase
MRSAVAAEAGGVVFAGASVDPYGPQTVRASAGAIFKLPVVRSESLDETVAALRSTGHLLVGTAADSPATIEEIDVTGPTAVFLGNEAWGLSGDHQSKLDSLIRIDMPGPMESLNVAVAGSLVLFEVIRRRRVASGPQ